MRYPEQVRVRDGEVIDHDAVMVATYQLWENFQNDRLATITDVTSLPPTCAHRSCGFKLVITTKEGYLLEIVPADETACPHLQHDGSAGRFDIIVSHCRGHLMAGPIETAAQTIMRTLANNLQKLLLRTASTAV
jgi:hypothetical protein